MKRLSTRAAKTVRLVLFLCAWAAFVWMVWRVFAATDKERLWEACLVCVGSLVLIVLRIPEVVHEAGHLLFGVCAGLRLEEVRIGWLSFGRGIRLAFGRAQAGEARFTLKSERGAHAAFFLAALGGPFFSIAAGVALLVPWLVFELHVALTLFALLAPFCLEEGIAELLPAELPTGKTDGLVLCELASRTGETEVGIRVMTAQLLLTRDPLAELPRDLLFGAPVVREDSPAFTELLRLQRQYLLSRGDRAGAEEIGARLAAIASEQGAGEKSDTVTTE